MAALPRLSASYSAPMLSLSGARWTWQLWSSILNPTPRSAIKLRPILPANVTSDLIERVDPAVDQLSRRLLGPFGIGREMRLEVSLAHRARNLEHKFAPHHFTSTTGLLRGRADQGSHSAPGRRRYARLFERDAQNPLGFRIDIEAV
jgi:hypothetical protein